MKVTAWWEGWVGVVGFWKAISKRESCDERSEERGEERNDEQNDEQKIFSLYSM